MQNDGKLGVAVTCQNLLSFFFFFFHLRAIKATNFLTKHMEQAAWDYCITVSRFADCLYRHWRGMYEEWRNLRKPFFFFFFEPVSGKKFIHVFLTSANIFPSASRRSCCCRNKPKNSSGVSYSFKPISCKLKPCATWSVKLSRALVSFFWSTWIICWLLVRVI